MSVNIFGKIYDTNIEEHFSVYRKKIKDFSKNVNLFRNLKTIQLLYCKIKIIPEDFCNSSIELERIELDNNKISDIFKFIYVLNNSLSIVIIFSYIIMNNNVIDYLIIILFFPFLRYDKHQLLVGFEPWNSLQTKHKLLWVRLMVRLLEQNNVIFLVH